MKSGFYQPKSNDGIDGSYSIVQNRIANPLWQVFDTRYIPSPSGG